MKNCWIVEFDKIGSHSDGFLTALEELHNIPFDIRRVYYIYDVPADTVRGFHAHRTLEQVLVCMHGSCRIKADNGTEKEEFLLDDPSKGLYTAPGIWREMYDFRDGAVLAVLASQYYDEDDYIRDYEKFLYWVNNK